MFFIIYLDYVTGAVVKPAWLESPETAGSTPTRALKFQRYKIFLPRSLVKIQYCEEPP